MKLDQYVEETIKQIIDGVNSASEYANRNGALVNPKAVGGATARLFVKGATSVPVHEIDFDVAVSVSESNNNAAPEITVGSITQSSTGASSDSQSSISRIKFTIPVALPIAR
ncbi:hypothetical protein [Vibrio vulnificus]|uniref:hypothetical protein n=1 Tax=Vibrio vulnificus TaxID=672 RepID=UPI001A1C2083|nr:hypothetical protein [Vibrio vulnificus]EGQ9330243.1 hypothetical protein [Vibrio vulnificus]EHZ7360185.1 hypothetical protein [Vibrio vulnificus]MBY7715275.1 hypothetical protein [Vibrio vulnificus]MBY7724586.1 hypothetical protein [Vibrio vulnificus]HAS6149428.1 hypothetical protein [Vibrio vulnificus]